MATGPGMSLKEERAIYDDACRTHFNLGRAQGRREGLEWALEDLMGAIRLPTYRDRLVAALAHVQAHGTLPGEAAGGPPGG